MGRHNGTTRGSSNFRFPRFLSAKTAATAGSILGAASISANVGIEVLAFAVMLVSSLCFAWVFRHTEREVVILNLSFAVINMIGIVRAL
tara:strand:+ start:72 stop:338 length:267 start_codon:yes stop_codon:yes gene_type:complete